MSSAVEALPAPAADETLDQWGPRRLHILQKKGGYRFSIDTLILADFIRLKPADRVLDLGTGCGILPLLLAPRVPRGRVIGLEVQTGLLDLAARNLRLNQLEGRVHILGGDIRRVAALFPGGGFDAVITNPPYRPLHTGRINPGTEKALARHEILLDLSQMLAGGRAILKDKGRFSLIHSFPDSNGEWVLLEAVKNGGEELTVLPALTVYERPGVYSPEVRRILGG